MSSSNTSKHYCYIIREGKGGKKRKKCTKGVNCGGDYKQQCVDKNRKPKWLEGQKIRRVPFMGVAGKRMCKWMDGSIDGAAAGAWSPLSASLCYSDDQIRPSSYCPYLSVAPHNPHLPYIYICCGGWGAVNPTTCHAMPYHPYDWEEITEEHNY